MFEKHLTPNEGMISYHKLLKLVTHQINEYKKVQKQIEEDTLYYVFNEPETLKDYKMLEEKIEEWEWLLNILEDEFEIKLIEV
jgi:hypothetical protein